MEDLGDDILGVILQLAAPCRSEVADKDIISAYIDLDKDPKCIHMGRVRIHRSVCQQWSRLLCSSFQCVLMERHLKDAGSALATLRTYKSMTHVRLGGPECRLERTAGGGELLRGLAEGFPLLTSLDVEISPGWELLPDLAHLLFHRTSLRELRLRFADQPWEVADHQWVMDKDPPYFATWRDYHALLAGLDFGGLVHLRNLSLDFRGLYFPTEAESKRDGPPPSLPVSTTLAQLPGLSSLHVTVPNAGQVARLPPWLGDLRSFSSLSISCGRWDHPSPQLLPSLANMCSLQELRLCLESPIGSPELRLIARLQSLTSLSLAYARTGRVDDDLAQEAIFNPRLRRLLVHCDELPAVLRARMPLLEELALAVSGQGAQFQHDLFAFTPALRSLDLRLSDTPAWPDLGVALLTGLTSLSLMCSSSGRRSASDVSRLSSTLQELKIGNCRLLERTPGVFGLGSATVVTLLCSCRSLNFRFDSFAEYTRRNCCKWLLGGRARQLFMTRGVRDRYANCTLLEAAC